MRDVALPLLLPGAPPRESPFKGDTLRRLVARRYELRLVERGLWSRPNTSTVVHDDEEEGDEGGSPRVDALPEMTPELREEIEEWLSRVVLTDGARRFPVRSLTRDAVNIWRRAGGEPPLPPATRYLTVVPASPVEAAAVRVIPAFPPPGRVTARTTATPAIDQARREEEQMGELTEHMKKVAETIDLPAKEAAERLGMTVNAIYTARSALKKKGALKVAPAKPLRKPQTKAAPTRGGGRAASFTVDVTERSDDALTAPLREALTALDLKRTRILTALAALGWEGAEG